MTGLPSDEEPRSMAIRTHLLRRAGLSRLPLVRALLIAAVAAALTSCDESRDQVRAPRISPAVHSATHLRIDRPLRYTCDFGPLRRVPLQSADLTALTAFISDEDARRSMGLTALHRAIGGRHSRPARSEGAQTFRGRRRGLREHRRSAPGDQFPVRGVHPDRDPGEPAAERRREEAPRGPLSVDGRVRGVPARAARFG